MGVYLGSMAMGVVLKQNSMVAFTTLPHIEYAVWNILQSLIQYNNTLLSIMGKYILNVCLSQC